MKKKILSFLLAGTMAFSLASCGKEASVPVVEEPAAEEPAQTAEEPAAEHTIEESAKDTLSYLPVTLSYEYDYRTADDGTTIVSGKCPVLELKELSLKDDGTTNWRQADGYEKLADAVNSWNQNSYVTFRGRMDEIEGYAKEDFGTDMWTEGMYYADETSATVTRGDASVLSVSLLNYYDAGGAHPGTTYSSVNFDSQTGDILSLSDVVKDTDDLVETVTDELQKNYPDINDGLISGDLQESVKTALTDPAYSPCFTLSGSGLSITFSAYDLTTYAYGPEFVTLNFADYPDLFTEKYTAADDTCFAPVAEGETVTNPAGQHLSWYLETAVTSEGIDDPANYKLHITVDGHETAFPAELSYSVKTYGLFKNNKYYLYCDGAGDDGYHSLLVYEISGTGAACLSGDTPLSLGFYDYTPVDSDHFILQGRSQVLGTEQVGRYYSVGTDGLPVKEDKPWTYIVTDENGDLSNRTLTVRQEVTMEEVRDADDYDFAKKRDTVTLEPDDKLTLRTTDNSNTAILETEDGKYLRVTLAGEDGDMVGGCQFIDGKDASEIFDGMILAG